MNGGTIGDREFHFYAALVIPALIGLFNTSMYAFFIMLGLGMSFAAYQFLDDLRTSSKRIDDLELDMRNHKEYIEELESKKDYRKIA